MKLQLLVSLLLCHSYIFSMKNPLVPFSENNEEVTIIDSFPYHITQNGCYALPAQQEIKIADVCDFKELDKSRIGPMFATGLIKVKEDVKNLTIDLNGCVIEGDRFKDYFIQLNDYASDDSRVEIFNGTIKNLQGICALYACFNHLIAHDLTFENCEEPEIYLGRSFRGFNNVVIDKDGNKRYAWNRNDL